MTNIRQNKLLKSKTFSYIMVLLLFILISVAFHYKFIFHEYISFVHFNRDNESQMMQFVPFLEKAFVDGNPFWSFSYGLGGDIFTEMSYYYTTSPFFYLQLFVKILFGDITNDFIVVLNYKLLFSVIKQVISMMLLFHLLKTENKATYSSIISAVVYGCSLWFMRNSLYFDFMTDAMVWLPLTIIAFRSYKKKGNPTLLIISIAFTIINSFYFGFMSCLFFATYFLIFNYNKGNSFSEYLKSLIKLIPIVLLALGIASVALLPSLNSIFSADRPASWMNLSLFPTRDVVFRSFDLIFTKYGRLFFPIIILFVFSLSILKTDDQCKKKSLLAGFWVLLMFIPLASCIINGFSHESDRWYYIVAFAVAYALPNWLEHFEKQKSCTIKSSVIIFAILALFYYTKPNRGLGYGTSFEKICLLLSFASIIILCIKNYLGKDISLKIKDKRLSLKTNSEVLVGLLNTTLVITIVLPYFLISNNYYVWANPKILNERTYGDKIYQKINTSLTPQQDEFYRVVDSTITEYIERKENITLNTGTFGVSSYNSTINGNLHRYIKQTMNIRSVYNAPSYYRGFDNRLFLETAWGVKYRIVSELDKTIPFGYTQSSLDSSVYETKNDVGIDLWYDSVISQDEYQKLTYAQKDAAILQTAVIGFNNKNQYKNTALDNTTTPISVKPATFEYVNSSYSNGVITAEKDAKIIIDLSSIKPKTNGEYLLTLDINEQDGNEFDLSVNNRLLKKFDDTYEWDYKVDHYTFWVDGNSKTIEISLTPGSYLLSQIDLTFNSYENLEQWVKERNQYNLTDLKIDGGNISGNITVDQNGILALNIPFNKGFQCSVNGEKYPLVPVNDVFTGIELTPGTYKINLTFTPPFLLLGFLITGISLIILIAFNIIRKFLKRK